MLDRSAVGQLSSLSSRTKWQRLTAGGLCGKLHGGRSQLFALYQSSIDSQLFVENRDLCLLHPHSTPLLWGHRRNIVMNFGTKKTRTVWLPDGEKI